MSWFTDFLWPEPGLCSGCGRPDRGSGGGERFCRRCLQRLPLLGPPVCLVCGTPLRHGVAGWSGEASATCVECRRRPRVFRSARAAGLYEGELRRLVHRLKFRRERRLAAPLGRLLVPVWRNWAELHRGQVLVPVPLGAQRLAERGFNQAEELALVLGTEVRRPVAVDALRRCDDRGVQSLRSRAGRAAVRAGAFQPFRPGAVAGRRAVLIDDVLTTGATAEACALALLRSGAASVDVLTVALAPAPADRTDAGR